MLSITYNTDNTYGVKVGSFPSTSAHDVRGDVYAVNDNTLRIVNFHYDGKGPGNEY